MPIAMASAADMFPVRRRALVLGVIGGAAEAGGVLGPIYGAGLTVLWKWQLIFLGKLMHAGNLPRGNL